MKIGRMVNRGTPIFADDLNRLIDDIERAMTLRTGAGIVGSWANSGMVLALAGGQSDGFVLARITAKTGLDPDIAENIRYDAKGIFESGAVLTNVYPSCGRPVKPDQAGIVRIRPAKVGALCWIVRDKQDDGTTIPKLWLPGLGGEYESVNWKKCGS